jgi:hypothetical protein
MLFTIDLMRIRDALAHDSRVDFDGPPVVERHTASAPGAAKASTFRIASSQQQQRRLPLAPKAGAGHRVRAFQE